MHVQNLIWRPFPPPFGVKLAPNYVDQVRLSRFSIHPTTNGLTKKLVGRIGNLIHVLTIHFPGNTSQLGLGPNPDSKYHMQPPTRGFSYTSAPYSRGLVTGGPTFRIFLESHPFASCCFLIITQTQHQMWGARAKRGSRSGEYFACFLFLRKVTASFKEGGLRHRKQTRGG
jgi:hypothetical protein